MDRRVLSTSAKSRRFRPTRRLMIALIALSLFCLFAGVAYADVTHIYRSDNWGSPTAPGGGGGDLTVYHREFNDACANMGTSGWVRVYYTKGNGSWQLPTMYASTLCGTNKAHLGPSQNYGDGTRAVQAKCDNYDGINLYLACQTSRPS